jgi:ABC-type transport system involved in cytochrome c biogenesis permease subunit
VAALGLTGLGVVLGAFWTRETWGRFWGWDAREVGGAAVVLWDAFMLVVLTRRPLGPHATLILGLVGNVVVALAWFGPNLIGINLHAYGYPPLAVPLAVFIIAQVAFACLGLVPPGGWRAKRASSGLG